MEITPAKIVLEFQKYPTFHPFRLISDLYYDNEGQIKEIKPDNVWAINTISAIISPLINLARYSKTAYEDMIHSKLKAKDKNNFNRHNLISAYCELSLMNTFLCRSTNPDSFVYEDRCRTDAKRNVEFSIKMDRFIFHVEVKTSNLMDEDRRIVEKLKETERVLVLDARHKDYQAIVNKAKKINLPLIGSLDRRIDDFLSSANEKFAQTTSEYEVNLLVICWDDRIQQPLMALKSCEAEGLLTSYSYKKAEDGSLQQYPNIDCILVNSNYSLFKDYINLVLYEQTYLYNIVNPFFQVFTNNYLIDHNLTADRIAIINSIIQQKTEIVDELYASTLPPVSIAFMKGPESNVISFRHINIEDCLGQIEEL